MDHILLARLQFATSLAFHIIFALVGVAMPVLMVLAEILWRRTGDDAWLALAKKWSKGTAILFAIGAVSGTVLSFELGLLFPRFMLQAGPLIGMPFSLEGFAFFLEAIFLGIYLYGWNKVSPRLHIAAGVLVACSGAASAAFVTLVNAWMNTPEGVILKNGVLEGVDATAALWTPAAAHEIAHMLVAGYMSTAFAVAGIHAHLLLRLKARGQGPTSPTFRLHTKALWIALAVAVPFTLAQPLVGHFAAQRVATLQPMKLAAMESLFETRTHAPLLVGGIPDYENERVRFGLEIPGGLSFLAFNRFDAEVKGLREIPKADWPHPIVHISFQVMVAIGTVLAGVSVAVLVFAWKRRAWLLSKGFLRVLVLCAPLGFIATEAGWVVTEVGRQPWVVYGLLLTRDSVTTMTDLEAPFILFTLVYAGLGIATAFLLRAYFRSSLDEKGGHAHGPVTDPDA